MQGTRAGYDDLEDENNDHPYGSSNGIDEATKPIDDAADHHPHHHHHHHQPQQAQHDPEHHQPQHLYYDPSHYHYMPPFPSQQHHQPPPPSLVLDHHIHHAPPPPPPHHHNLHHHHPVNHLDSQHPYAHSHSHPRYPSHPQQQQQQQQHATTTTMRPADPMWGPSPAAHTTNHDSHDPYLQHVVDTADYHLYPTTTAAAAAAAAPFDDIMMLPLPTGATAPPPPPPLAIQNKTTMAATTIITRRSPRKAKNSKTTAAAAAGSRSKSRKGGTAATDNAATTLTMTAAASASNHAGAGDATYVLRIHDMLEDAETEGQTHIVSWQPHGRAFRIHNEALFVRHIMPRYFKAKIGSFRRWLRAWGFARMTEGKDRGAWYHRYFVRGVTSFCKGMTRQQMASSMIQWPPAGQVPDFYSAATERMLSEEQPNNMHEQQRGQSSMIASQVDGDAAEEDGDDEDAAADDNVGTPNHNQVPLAKNPRRLRGTILEDLRQMLDDAEQEGQTHIVSWMPHGRAFKIHDKDLFQGQLMPRYFRTAKVTHLSDTLRIWGFRRLKKNGRDKGSYFHKYFVRGDPRQSRHLPREQMKACMNDWPGPAGEPDLYQIVANDAPKATTPTTAAPQLPANMNAAHATTCESDFKNTSDATQAAAAAAATGHPMNHHDPSSFPDLRPAPGYPTEQNPEIPAPVKKHEIGTLNRGDGTYVLRLFEMLEDAEKEGHQRIVSWQPHGRAFRIHKEEEFVKQIMPRYFKAQMKSFLRWCRAWGFVRMTEGRDRGAWYHRYFIRGVTAHSRSMSRQQMFKAMQDWLPPGYVPNFYESGSGNILSETRNPQQPVKPPPNVTCKNVKRLRGTVPEDLRQMLEEAETEGNVQIVSWLSHGRAFQVHDKAAFADHILPRYFKASKYTYFSDALRMWGWQRIKHGRDKGSYYHKLFVKDQPQLTRHLTRIQMKNSMSPWPPPEGEPNLYAPLPPEQQQQQQRDSDKNESQHSSPAGASGTLAVAATVPLPTTEVTPPSLGAPMEHGIVNTTQTAAADSEAAFEDLDLKHSAHQWQAATV